MTRALTITLALLHATAALSHSFYDLDCCNTADCGPAMPGEIVHDPRGWRVVPTGEIISGDKVRHAPDGRFHRCLANPKDRTSRTYCLYVPDGDT